MRGGEGDGVIIAVKRAAEVGDGCPGRADGYGDVVRQAIVAVIAAGAAQVKDQVVSICDALACRVGIGRTAVGGVGDAVAIGVLGVWRQRRWCECSGRAV